MALADMPLFMWVLADCLPYQDAPRENRGLSILPSAVSHAADTVLLLNGWMKAGA